MEYLKKIISLLLTALFLISVTGISYAEHCISCGSSDNHHEICCLSNNHNFNQSHNHSSVCGVDDIVCCHSYNHCDLIFEQHNCCVQKTILLDVDYTMSSSQIKIDIKSILVFIHNIYSFDIFNISNKNYNVFLETIPIFKTGQSILKKHCIFLI